LDITDIEEYGRPNIIAINSIVYVIDVEASINVTGSHVTFYCTYIAYYINIFAESSYLELMNIIPITLKIYLQSIVYHERIYYSLPATPESKRQIAQNSATTSDNTINNAIISNSNYFASGYELLNYSNSTEFINSNINFDNTTVILNNMNSISSDINLTSTTMNLNNFQAFDNSSIIISNSSNATIGSCDTDNIDSNSKIVSQSRSFNNLNGGDGCPILNQKNNFCVTTQNDSSGYSTYSILFYNPAQCSSPGDNNINSPSSLTNTAMIAIIVCVVAFVVGLILFIALNVALKTKCARAVFPHRLFDRKKLQPTRTLNT